MRLSRWQREGQPHGSRESRFGTKCQPQALPQVDEAGTGSIVCLHQAHASIGNSDPTAFATYLHSNVDAAAAHSAKLRLVVMARLVCW